MNPDGPYLIKSESSKLPMSLEISALGGKEKLKR